MVAALASIAEESRLFNPFLGELGVTGLRAQVERLTESVPPLKRAEEFEKLGMEELRLGNAEAAVAALSNSYKLRRTGPTIPSGDKSAYNLGLAHMRWAENQNCVARHCCNSCIFPIQGDGVHVEQDNSKEAIKYFTESLEQYPSDLASRWLLNVAYMTVGAYPDGVPQRYRIPPKTFNSDEEFPRFVDVAPQLGLNTFDLAGGMIPDDFDGDNWLDVVESNMDPSGQLRFFHNNGDGTFIERTEEAGLTGIAGGLNMLHADYNNDGHLDVLVQRGAWFGEYGRMPRSLLRNDGHGTFTDVTFDAGLAEVNSPSQTAAWSDYDNDGDLDLYAGNESRAPEEVFPNQLFRNEGDGTFVDVADQAGVKNLRFAKGVVWGDYDADGRPDLYVSNLGEDNRLYHNNGDGTFTDVAPSLGMTGPKDSFAVWFWDYDNDGALDIYATTYYRGSGNGAERLEAVAATYLGQPSKAEAAKLYRGDGRGAFRDVAAEQGLARIKTLPMGANFGDLDNDGWLDFYLGTGYPNYDGLIPNVMYRNRGGTGFSDVTTAGGFGHLQKGHGVAFADYDHDGDQDVFEQMGGAYPGDGFANAVYQNPGFSNHWIALKLVGVRSNRSAIGARIRVEIVEKGRKRSVYRWVNSGGSFGANPLRQHFGLGQAEKIEMIEVHWPTTGVTQTFREVPVDQLVEITEGKNELRPIPLRTLALN
jgi:hypothetical protein